MNKNNLNSISVGNLKEDLAATYLLKKGYSILERNFRWKRSEIDIICTDHKTVVFVEVKYRSNLEYGYPEQFVGAKKIEMILKGAEHYVTETNWAGHIRFDIISISEVDELLHIEDAF